MRLIVLTMEKLDFGYGHGRNFYHYMTMTPRRRPNGKKIVVSLPTLPPPPPPLAIFQNLLGEI